MNSQFTAGPKAFAWLSFALLCALVALSGTLPWMGFVLYLLPVPLIVFAVTDEMWLPGVLAAFYAVAMLLAGYAWTAPLTAIAVFFIAWVIGDAIKNRESPYAPLITGTLVVVMISLVRLAFLHWLGIDVVNYLIGGIANHAPLGANPDLMGIDAGTLNQIYSAETDFLQTMLPALICITSFITATVNLLLARRILRSGSASTYTVVDKPLLRTWHLPTWVALGFLVTLLCSWFGVFSNSYYLWELVNNAWLFSGFLISIQGIAFLWRKLLGVPGKYWLLLLLILVGIGIYMIYVLVGLFDMLYYTRQKGD